MVPLPPYPFVYHFDRKGILKNGISFTYLPENTASIFETLGVKTRDNTLRLPRRDDNQKIGFIYPVPVLTDLNDRYAFHIPQIVKGAPFGRSLAV